MCTFLPAPSSLLRSKFVSDFAPQHQETKKPRGVSPVDWPVLDVFAKPIDAVSVPAPRIRCTPCPCAQRTAPPPPYGGAPAPRRTAPGNKAFAVRNRPLNPFWRRDRRRSRGKWTGNEDRAGPGKDVARSALPEQLDCG